MKALEVQRHDLSGATDMVLKLGVKQFYTAIVAFSSPSERDAGTKILKEHFKLPGYCARVTSCTPSRDPRAVYQFTVQQAVEVLIKDQARANLADLLRLDLKPDDEFDSVCTRFGMVFWIDAIENNTVAAVACFNLKGAVVPFESPSTKFVEVASWTGGESIAKQYVPRIMQQLHDLFGTQFRYNGLQYCLSEVRQLADHFAGSFLLQIPGGGSRHRGQLMAKTIPTSLVSVIIKARCGRRTIFKRTQRKYSDGSVMRIFKVDKMSRKAERAERKRPCWKISMTWFVSLTKKLLACRWFIACLTEIQI